jgi:serine/alanine adding enzyme
MKTTLIKNSKDISKLYSDLAELPNLNVFQSHFYYNIMSTGRETNPEIIIAEEDGKIKGLMLVQIQNYFSSLLKSISSRSIISGGPIFNGEEYVLEALLAKYNLLFKKRVVYTQFRNMYDLEKYVQVFAKYGYKKTAHVNYIIDLKDDIEVIWNNVYSKRKNEIRRGIKEGVVVKEILNGVDLETTYDIVSIIYRKAKLPLPGYDYFKNAIAIQGDNYIFRVLGGYYDSKLIGVMYLLCFEGRVYNWYAASNPVYYKMYPNDVITWEAIKWSVENGYKVFDFGGAGNPSIEYGVREFKRKFGGKEVNYGRFECIHKTSVMKISKYGFKLWQKLR